MNEFEKFPQLKVPVKDALPSGMMMDAASIATGMAFLTGELEKRDPKLNEPMTSTSWPRDLPVRTGGGWNDTVSMFDVGYADPGSASNGGLIGPETNVLARVQADIGKEQVRTHVWGMNLMVPYIDQQKLQQIGRSLDEILNKGLHLTYDKMLDRNAYEGVADGSYGLLNDPEIVTVTADPHTPGGTDTDWFHKTPDEILADVNRLILATWEASEYDLSGMANHILLPPKKYAHLVQTKVAADSGKSILQFLLENNIGKNQGVEPFFAPCRWCEGAGTGGTDRMMGYANSVDRVRFDITVPLRRVMTMADANSLSYLSPYVSQFSDIQWPYRQHAMYMDGI